MTHPLTWQQAGQGDEGFRDFFIPALVDLGASVIIQDARHDYVFVTNLPDVWSSDLSNRPTDASLFGEEIGKKLATLKSDLGEPGRKAHMEVTVGSERVFEFRVQSLNFGERGLHLITTIVDRSEERHRERLLRALLREVSHRSKNLLAIIQSIALQTARYSGSLDLFLNKFRGRLYSLSQSQDLITDSSWRGAYFFELVQHQTDKYLPDNTHLVRVSGDNILLSPNASLHIGLALHELIVNAVSHGALLKNGRTINVTCTRIHSGGHDSLQMSWKESLDTNDADADDCEALKSHFGSTVLERVVPASVNGQAEYVISREQISYRLTFPLDHGGE